MTSISSSPDPSSMEVSNLVGNFIFPMISYSDRQIQLQKELNRRDNLEDFVAGLVRTEVFPYPSGQHDVVPSITVPVQEVTLKPNAYVKLTTLHLCHTYVKVHGRRELVDMTVTLTPELGVGTFEMSYTEPDAASEGVPPLGESEALRLRMALWGRYEWVVEKIDYINELRREVADGDKARSMDSPNLETSDIDLEEEADPYDSDDVSSMGSGDWDSLKPEFVADTHYLQTEEPDFPDAKQLGELDMDTLKALFERKELQSLHSAIKAHTRSSKSPTEAADNNDNSTAADGTKKRPITITEDDVKTKRPRLEYIDSIMSNFCTVAQALPNAQADGQRIRAFRQATGTLHLAARILELEHNLDGLDDDESVTAIVKSPRSVGPTMSWDDLDMD